MGRGLFAITQNGQAHGVRAREDVGGDGTRRGGANGRDLARVDDADRFAGSGLEQHHQSLMRLPTLGEILRIDTDQLRSEGRVFAQGTRHDAEQMPLRQRDDGAQQLARLAPGKGDHRLPDDRNAHLIGQAIRHFFPFDQPHITITPWVVGGPRFYRRPGTAPGSTLTTYRPVGMYHPMEQGVTARSPKAGARQQLLAAAFSLIRAKGYSSTSVDELCAKAGVTKGAFFHHFKSKDALAVAAANHWSEITGAFFETAPYHAHSDPLDRVLGYLDFRKAILKGEIAEFTCLVGTMVQEIYGTNPDIRDACGASISRHAARIETDIAAAMMRHRIRTRWTAESLALHTQAVLQGAFILAKATGDAAVAAASIDHLRRYIEMLFQPARPKRKETS